MRVQLLLKNMAINLESNPVGTGPFKFVEWKPNETITIEKFDDYWQEGLPKLDESYL